MNGLLSHCLSFTIFMFDVGDATCTFSKGCHFGDHIFYIYMHSIGRFLRSLVSLLPSTRYSVIHNPPNTYTIWALQAHLDTSGTCRGHFVKCLVFPVRNLFLDSCCSPHPPSYVFIRGLHPTIYTTHISPPLSSFSLEMSTISRCSIAKMPSRSSHFLKLRIGK